MTLYSAKPAFVRWLRPLALGLARRGVTANAVTLTAAGLSVALGLALAGDALNGGALRGWLLLPAFLFVRMALNAVDGIMAREGGQRSRLGAYLNELGDAVSDAALYLPLALLPGGWPAPLLVAAALSGELAGVLGQVVGASRRYDGPLGKSDRALLIGAVGLALGLGVRPGAWLSGLLLLAAGLAVWGAWNRMRRGLAEGAAPERP